MHYSNLLIDEPPLQVLPKLAEKIGLNEAIILQQMHYWLKITKHEHDGKRWIYNSYPKWTEQFPFWSESTIKRTIKSLEKQKLIFVGNYNKVSFDRTKWYSINYYTLNKLVYRSSGQNDPTMRSKWNGVTGQNDPTNTRDYTENTSERENAEGDCIQKYQNEIGILNPNQIKQLIDWIEDFNKNNEGEEIISEAINQSVKEKARTFAYLNNKLRRYADAKVETVEQAKQQSKDNKMPYKKKDVDVTSILEDM